MGGWKIGYNNGGKFALYYGDIGQAIATVRKVPSAFNKTVFQSDGTVLYCPGSPTLKWSVWNPNTNTMADVGTCNGRWCVNADDATTKVA